MFPARPEKRQAIAQNSPSANALCNPAKRSGFPWLPLPSIQSSDCSYFFSLNSFPTPPELRPAQPQARHFRNHIFGLDAPDEPNLGQFFTKRTGKNKKRPFAIFYCPRFRPLMTVWANRKPQRTHMHTLKNWRCENQNGNKATKQFRPWIFNDWHEMDYQCARKTAEKKQKDKNEQLNERHSHQKVTIQLSVSRGERKRKIVKWENFGSARIAGISRRRRR